MFTHRKAGSIALAALGFLFLVSHGVSRVLAHELQGSRSVVTSIVPARDAAADRAMLLPAEGSPLRSTPWLAPIGHRQPRADEVPVTPGSHTADAEQARLDAELTRKLMICRGC
jgi:hypothetical protein